MTRPVPNSYPHYHPKQYTCVAIGECGILIEGRSGSGKSTLALSLIDRGAAFIGDDSVFLETRALSTKPHLFAHPHPNTKGLLEIRNLGILPFPIQHETIICMLVHLTPQAPRYREKLGVSNILDIPVPTLELTPHCPALPLKVEWAIRHFRPQDMLLI